MSDEPARPQDAPQPAPPGIWEHLCEHPGCSAWGSFGFTRGRNWPVRWYCHEHRAEGEATIG